MQKFHVYLAASVDGYIAEADGSVAWLDAFEGEGSEDAKNLGNTSDQNPYGYAPFYETISTLVFGRTTFDQVLSFDVSWPYAGKQTLVMTHRDPPDVSIDGVSFVSRSAEDIAAGLEGSKGDVWLIGGADVIGQFLDAGRVDSIKIFVMPVLLGSGIPTFPRDRLGPGPALELSGSTSFDSGVVRLLYTAK